MNILLVRYYLIYCLETNHNNYLSELSLFSQHNWTKELQKVPSKILPLLESAWFRHIFHFRYISHGRTTSLHKVILINTYFTNICVLLHFEHKNDVTISLNFCIELRTAALWSLIMSVYDIPDECSKNWCSMSQYFTGSQTKKHIYCSIYLFPSHGLT